MDKKTLIKKLNKTFSDIILGGKKYAEVWLTEMDFGGLYRNGTYVLHVRPEPKAESYIQEIHDILSTLDREAKDTLPYISTVKIHNNPDERVERHWDDIEVYNEEMAVSK